MKELGNAEYSNTMPSTQTQWASEENDYFEDCERCEMTVEIPNAAALKEIEKRTGIRQKRSRRTWKSIEAESSKVPFANWRQA